MLKLISKDCSELYEEIKQSPSIYKELDGIELSSANADENWEYLTNEQPMSNIRISGTLMQMQHSIAFIVQYCKLPELRMALKLMYGWDLVSESEKPTNLKKKDKVYRSKSILLCILKHLNLDCNWEKVISSLRSSDKLNLEKPIAIMDGMAVCENDPLLLKNAIWHIGLAHKECPIYLRTLEDLCLRLSIADCRSKCPSWLILSRGFELLSERLK